jgi:hypothetical protein
MKSASSSSEKAAPRRRVHPQVGLVEQGQRRPCGQPEDHPEGRPLAEGELAELRVPRDLEALDQRVGVVAVPAGPQAGRGVEGVADPLVLVAGVAGLADEADPAGAAGVLEHRLAVDQHGAPDALRNPASTDSRLVLPEPLRPSSP